MKETRITEQPSHYSHLEQLTVEQLTADINQENIDVPKAVGKALPQLNRLIKAIEQQLRKGGTALLRRLRNRRTTRHTRHHRSAKHLWNRRNTDTSNFSWRH